MDVHVSPGAATGVGSLPHLDARAAAEFVLDRLPDLPSIPSLPTRSPAEGMIAQALVGVRGVHLDRGGELDVDPAALDPAAPVDCDLDHDAFGGLRAFLEVAAGRTGPVKWQVTGPITLGLALIHRGAPAEVAFTVASRAVEAHITRIHRAVTGALSGAPQVVVLDEPGLAGLLAGGVPLAAAAAIDVVSAALASAEPNAAAGVHCCGQVDVAALLATGPRILSVPVRPDLVEVAGYLASFLAAGGWVAWGCVPTDGPVATNADRLWRDLAGLWSGLVQAGCDPVRLRQQALVTPACGLGLHSVEQAARVLDLVVAVGRRVRGKTAATRLSIGA